MAFAREVAARLALLRAQHRSLLQLAARHEGGGAAASIGGIAPPPPPPPPPPIAIASSAAPATAALLAARPLSTLAGARRRPGGVLLWGLHQQAATAGTTTETTPTTTTAIVGGGARAFSSSGAAASAAAATATTPQTSGPLRPYAAAPRPLPRMRRLRDGFTWRRMVVRVPPEVSVELVEDEGGSGAAAGDEARASGGGGRRRLVLTGRAGRLELDLSHLDPTGLVAMQLWQRPGSGGEGDKGGPAAGGGEAAAAGGGALLLCASPDRRCFRGIATHVDNAVRGVTQGYLQGVTVKGVGYRLEPYFEEDGEAAAAGAGAAAAAATSSSSTSKRRLFWEPPPVLEGSGGSGGGGGGGGKNARAAGVAAGPAVTYPVTRPASAVRMKVGFKAAAVVRLPAGVRAFFVRPTLAYLYGADRAAVGNAAAALRAVRPPNAYTGNGVQLVGEEIKLRQRAGAK